MWEKNTDDDTHTSQQQGEGVVVIFLCDKEKVQCGSYYFVWPM